MSAMRPSEHDLHQDGGIIEYPEITSRSSAGNRASESLRIIGEHVNRNYEHDPTIKENWRTMPEIPSAKEILPDPYSEYGIDLDEKRKTCDPEPDLPENIVDRPWGSKAEYVSTHYQLLREDAVAPLRNAVAAYKDNPMMDDDTFASIYTNVFIVGYTSSRIGMAARVQFLCQRDGKRIRWAQSKRLQQGTLVALTTPSDKFRTICKIAVVAGRPLAGVMQNPPEVDLFWGDFKDATFDSTEEFVMIEARDGYFEANRHMLVALQKLMFEKFPFSNELVALDEYIDTPTYVECRPFRDLSSLSCTENANDKGATEDTYLKRVNILGEWPVIQGSKLDKSQTMALKRILTKKVAIIQGPPGTGKTFVSLSALKVMLDNWSHGDSPIIVSAQTNHALDQLLTLIAPIEPNFVRLGSRCSKANEIVRDRTLHEVRNRLQEKSRLPYGKYRHAKNLLKDLGDKIRNIIHNAVKQGEKEAETLRDLKVITQDQYESLVDDQWVYSESSELPPGAISLWLGVDQVMPVPRCPMMTIAKDELEGPDYEELDEFEAEMIRKDEDDDMDALSGTYFTITEEFVGRRIYNGYTDRKIQSILDSTSNLWDIEQNIRGHVYRYIRRKLKKVQFEAFQAHMEDYERGMRIMKIAKWEIDASVIKQAEIKLIGCTTTGLSKYRGLLAALKPQTMLIEEAAEALEGTVLAAAFESLEHLILVGDHKQLQASCTLPYLHNPPYNLGVSLFERLVRSGTEYTMLNEQRRMIPEIRMLLNPFYENLRDHKSVLDRVKNRKPIPGMGGKDSYFFHHNWPESRDDFASRLNIYEAEMIVNFYNYLVVNGTDHAQITILTFYNGQRKLIQKLLRKQACLPPDSPFNVFTVDSYQGEENDVIILSLVRSNDEYSIGFLDNENRAVVSLSRARRGLYIFGNTINLLMANDMSNLIWGGVTDSLRDSGRFVLDGGLPLVCQNHQTQTIVREPDDWVALSGGCNLKCEGKLGCGHPCPHQCHPFKHSDVICKEPCPVRRACGHRCAQRCGDICLCRCDTTSQREISSHAVKGPRQSPLDEALTENNNGSSARHPRMTSRPPAQVSSRLNPRAPSSGLQKWREWDASRGDKIIDDYRRSQQRSYQNHSITYKETHRRIAIKEGSRVSESASTRFISGIPSASNQLLSETGILVDITVPEAVSPLNIQESNDRPGKNCDGMNSGTGIGIAVNHRPSEGQGANRVPGTPSPAESVAFTDIYSASEDQCPLVQVGESAAPTPSSAENCPQNLEEDLISFD